MADGSVSIQVDMQTGDAQKQLDRLTKDIDKMQSALNKRQGNKLAIQKQIEDARDEAARLKIELDKVAADKAHADFELDFKKTELDAAENELKSLGEVSNVTAAKFEKMKEQLAEMEAEYAELTAGQRDIAEQMGMSAEETDEFINSTSARAKELADAMQRTAEDIDKIQSYQATAGKVSDLRSEYAELEKAANDYAGAVESAEENLTAARDRVSELENEEEIAANDARKLSNQIDRAQSEAGNMAAKIALGTAFDTAIQKAKELTAHIRDGVVKGLQTMASVAGKAALAIGNGIESAAKKLNVFSAAAQKIGPAFQKLGSMVKRVFLFSVLTAGLRSLRETMGNFLAQNAELTAALNQTKAALTTAFMPIYNVIVPALITLANVLTSVLSVFARFTALVFGGTAKQAQANAKALTAQAGATKKAGGAAKSAAKEQKKFLASFDEINQIGDKNAGAGGGGGGGGGVDTSGFDLDFDDAEVKSWGQALSDALDAALEKVEHLPEVFQRAADKINGVAQKVLDAFTFPGITAKVAELGTKLATAFNSLVDYINWRLIGSALGAGLNFALQFVTSFIYGFDWQALGAGLAKMFNGLVNYVNWWNVGALLWAGFKIGLETLAGFIIGLDMPQLAQAASHIVMGFFDSMTDTIDSIRWDTIGDQISAFLIGIDWVGIGVSVSNAFNAVVTGLKNFISRIQWKDTAKKFTDGINTMIKTVNWKGAGEFIGNFFKGALDFFIVATENFDWRGLANSIAEFLEGMDWPGILQRMAQALGAAIGGISAFIVELIKKPFVAFNQMIGDYMAETGDYTIQGFYRGLGNAIANVASWVKEHIFDPFINGFKAAFGIASPSTKMKEQGGYIIAGMLEGITDALRTIGTWVRDNIFNPFTNAFKTAFDMHSPSKVMKSLGGNVASGFLDGIKEGWKAVTEWANNAISSLMSSLRNAISSVKSGLSGATSSISTKVQSVLTTAKKKSIAAPRVAFDASDLAIPQLATGAVIPPNREFLAVLGDQKQGTNIEAPLNTIVQAFRQVMSEQGNGRNQTIVLQLDRRELGRAVVDAYNLESQRVGTRLGGAY